MNENHKRLLLFQWKYTKTPMSKFECFGHAVKGQIYFRVRALFLSQNYPKIQILKSGQWYSYSKKSRIF